MSASEAHQLKDIAVSAIVPCYNQGEFILEAIASVERCQDKVYEILIVNDGSTDPKTQKVLSYLLDKGYCVIVQENQGLAAARNAGINKAIGRYILTLDADNKIEPDYITKAIEILDEMPEVGVVYGNAELFGEKTGIVEVPEFEIDRLMAGNYIDACAVFRKTLWQDCGGYDSHIPEKFGYEDWDFWLGAAERGWQFYHVPEVLYHYRFRYNSMVSACNVPENRRQLFRYICSKHIGLYATNFANIYANKECELLKERETVEALEFQLKKAEFQVELMRSQLSETKVQLGEIQVQLQETERRETLEKPEQKHQKRKTLWQEVEELQAELERVRLEKQYLETECDRTRQQYRQTRADLEAELLEKERSLRSQQETLEQNLDRTRTEMQSQLDEIARSSQEQLQQTQAELHANLGECDRARNELQVQLQHAQAALEQSQIEIAAMKTSKFWKLRSQWFKLKQTLGMGE